MGILEKIKDIEHEISRTQKNKATEYHLVNMSTIFDLILQKRVF